MHQKQKKEEQFYLPEGRSFYSEPSFRCGYQKIVGSIPTRSSFFFGLSPPFLWPQGSRKSGKRAPPGGAHLVARGGGGGISAARATPGTRSPASRPLPVLGKWNGKSHCIFDPGVINESRVEFRRKVAEQNPFPCLRTKLERYSMNDTRCVIIKSARGSAFVFAE